MNSIHCPECSTEVSGSQNHCPHCNFPVSKLRGLSAAILTKNEERVAGLIQIGADVNSLDKNDRTPLMLAALLDAPDIVQMLLAAGAKPEFVNKAGETALSVAKSRDVERLIRRAIVVSRFNKTAPPRTSPPPVQPVQSIVVSEWENPKEINFEPAVIEQTNLVEAPVPQEPQVQEMNLVETPVIEEPEVKKASSLEFDPLWMMEVSAWENRRDFKIDSPTIHETTEIEPRLTEEPTIQEESSFELNYQKEIPPPTFAIEDHEEPPNLKHSHLEPSLEFDPRWMMEVSAWENRKEFKFEPATIRAISLEEIQAIAESENKEEPAFEFDRLWFPEISEWKIQEELRLELAEIQDTSEIEPQLIEEPIVREEIPPPAVDVHERLIPLEHIPLKKKSSNGYFLASTLGSLLLIAFMALTWPRNYEPPFVKSTENPKPVNEIIKMEAPKNSEIIPNPPETKIESKPEVLPEPEKPKPVLQKKIIERTPAQRTVESEDKIALARALNNQGFSLIKQGRPGDAIPVLERSLRTFPKDTKDPYYAYALFNLGVAWRKAGRPDLAIPILEKRIRIDNQRDLVARELNTARQEAEDQGFGNFKN